MKTYSTDAQEVFHFTFNYPPSQTASFFFFVENAKGIVGKKGGFIVA
jgi:hypothetical protein